MKQIACIRLGKYYQVVEAEKVVLAGGGFIRIIGKDGYDYDTSENNVVIMTKREEEKNED